MIYGTIALGIHGIVEALLGCGWYIADTVTRWLHFACTGRAVYLARGPGLWGCITKLALRSSHVFAATPRIP